MRRGSKKNRFVDRWIGVPLLNALATLRRRRSFPSRIERIGLVCSFALGDTLLFSAAVRSIRAHYPAARLVFFCGRQNIAAAQLIGGVDELVLIDLLDPKTTIRTMRAQRVDLLLDFTPWQRLTAFYSMVSGARFTVGFRTAGQHRARGYDRTIEHRRDLHELDNFRALHTAAGIPEVYPPTLVIPEVPLPDLLRHNRDVVVFHPWPSGVRSHTREWPQERWVELAERWSHLPGKSDTLFVVTGAPADEPRSDALVRRLLSSGLHAECFVGRDGFASLCQLLRHSHLVVSVNTGVMHLAAILGAPTLSLNGPTNNQRWGPVGPRAIGIQPPGTGCGYLHFGFEHSQGANDCMERITVEMVLAAGMSLLQTPATAATQRS